MRPSWHSNRRDTRAIEILHPPPPPSSPFQTPLSPRATVIWPFISAPNLIPSSVGVVPNRRLGRGELIGYGDPTIPSEVGFTRALPSTSTITTQPTSGTRGCSHRGVRLSKLWCGGLERWTTPRWIRASLRSSSRPPGLTHPLSVVRDLHSYRQRPTGQRRPRPRTGAFDIRSPGAEALRL